MEAALDLTSRVAPLPAPSISRWLGQDLAPPVPPDPKDRRFADPTWNDNPWFYSMRAAYSVFRQVSADIVDGVDVDPLVREKAQVVVNLLGDAMAPTNFFASNPAALKLAFETGGTSLLRGARNFLDDLQHNNGRPRQVDTSSFVLDENLAATPAKVVFATS